MARYTGAVCRQCRREGLKLYLKGERCYTEKCGVDRRAYAPGQHGQRRRGKTSEYGLQLREKQKARRIYGVLESQFRRYFREADRRKGITGENLLQILEARLDNIVYRMGFALSRPEARQLVKHGHFSVNGKKVTIPSYQVRPGDEIAVREASRTKGRFKELAELTQNQGTMEWLEVNRDNLAGKVVRLPNRDEIDIPITEHLIVELYSR
ncbi:MAG TPA: 30S ribosomal protein S4 [Oscillospiraceae bacterium]|nr:30S ribosomal protein S4 [Oscillospiraceae bacterium]